MSREPSILPGHGSTDFSSNASFDVEEATISGVHAAMAEGKITARRLVEIYLERIAAFDKQGPSINAIIHINAQALEVADQLDNLFRTSGLCGSLHGVPILVKDAIATDDMPTTGGSLSLRGFTPRRAATLVARLKAAGAIILGKTNLDEFTFGNRGVSSLGGQTLNPYDVTRSPAGSSGGSAAAVAANFAMAALGTDTGSSIRFPASSTALVGIRPTVGLVSRMGVMPNSATQDTAGPIARTVADAAAILDVISGYDPADPATAWCVGNIPQSYSASLDAAGLQGARIGVLTSFFGAGAESAEVNRVAKGALACMEANGATLLPVDDEFDIIKLRDMQPATYETTFYLDKYLEAEHAPHRSLASILRSGEIAKEVEASVRNRVQCSMNDPEYPGLLLGRIELQNRVMKLMADMRIDAIVYPFSREFVGKAGGEQARHNGYLGAVTGFPGVVAPAGFSAPDANAPIGVPIGVEFLGRPWSEALLIRLAHAFELASKARRPPAAWR